MNALPGAEAKRNLKLSSAGPWRRDARHLLGVGPAGCTAAPCGASTPPVDYLVHRASSGAQTPKRPVARASGEMVGG
ncbi:MAG: hypothetical protein DVS81_01750 [Candidatus Accumulibacter meliphilus]|uniref:Uncharacterized protein n=1 Tax=Candidatus Accumulibacter meliphilus TaxID=2211374 RepID=A0A369XYR9_9PROT|nr:MAG: hypothetical protein DVS81_01750 [Candidatus Accumulibacter meliphilus]